MSTNVTEDHGGLFESVPVTLIVMMRITALLILFLNGTVLLCLCVKKQNMPRIYNLQILCLCLTDNMAGAALLSISFVDYDWFRTDFIRCCFLFGFFMSSQSTTLYNVTAICINRFIIMLRMDKLDHHLTRAKVVAFSMAALIFSFASCSLPFFSFGSRYGYPYHTACSFRAVFRENLESSMKMFCGTFLTPLLITNLLYGYLFFMLRRKQRRIRPGIQSATNNDAGQSATKLRTKVKETTLSERGTFSDKILSPTAGPANINPIRLDTSAATAISSITSSSSSSGRNIVSVATFTKYVPSKHLNRTTTPSTSDSNSERRAHQSKAFTLLGFILLSLNICTWPGVILLMMGSVIDSWSFSRGSIIPLFSTISFNSIINPILYAVTVKEFRTVLSDMLLCSQSRVSQ